MFDFRIWKVYRIAGREPRWFVKFFDGQRKFFPYRPNPRFFRVEQAFALKARIAEKLKIPVSELDLDPDPRVRVG